MRARPFAACLALFLFVPRVLGAADPLFPREGMAQDDSLLIHPQLRGIYLRDITFKNLKERQNSVLEQFGVFHGDLVLNETPRALVFSFDEYHELFLFPGAEMVVRGNQLHLKRGSMLLRSLVSRAEYFLVNAHRVGIGPRAVLFVSLAGEFTEILVLSGQGELNGKRLDTLQASLGSGARSVEKGRLKAVLREIEAGVAHLLTPVFGSYREDLETEIFAIYKAGKYANAIFHAWLHRIFFGVLSNDRGIFEEANRKLQAEIIAGSAPAATFAALALVYHITEQHEKALSILMQGRRAHRKDPGLEFFKFYFQSATGVKEAQKALRDYIRPENPLYSLLFFTQEGDRGIFHEELLEFQPAKIAEDPLLPALFGPPGSVIREIFKKRIFLLIGPRFLNAWILNKPTTAVRLGEYLKSVFPGVPAIRKILANQYREIGNTEASLQEWSQCKPIVTPEEYLYLQAVVHQSGGALLAARGFFEKLSKDHNRPLWILKQMALANLVRDFNLVKSLAVKLSGTRQEGYPLVRYLELQGALRQMDRDSLRKILPAFLKENRGEIFQVLDGVNSFLLGEKLKAVQVLESLRKSARREETRFLTKHLVDSFLENNTAEIERVMIQVDLLSPALFSN